MSNKVSVNIFGHEYTITGGQSTEQILQVASWVDQKMKEIDEAVGNSFSTTSLAVLSAVNVANDYFQQKKEIEEANKLAYQKGEDAKRYMELWNETKKNFQEFQERVASVIKEKEELERAVLSKQKQIDTLLQGQGSIQQEIEKGTQAKMKEAREKYKELESNFFDLQMENIKIKSELEKLRG